MGLGGALAAVGTAGKVAGAVGQSKAMGAQADSLEAQAAMTMRIGEYNANIYQGRHDTMRENEKHSYYLANFTADQSRYEANMNRSLAFVQNKWQQKFATLQAQQGRHKAKGLRLRANSVDKFSEEDRLRHTKQGRQLEGKAVTATAGSGVTMAGSPMEVMVEQAEQLELQRLDILTKSQTESQDLRYQADLAEYEANTTEKAAYFQAGVGKFLADFQALSTEQAGLIEHNKLVRQGHNFRDQALDYKDQAKITMMEAEQQAYGQLAQAGATRRAGKAALFTGLASAAVGGGKLLAG